MVPPRGCRPDDPQRNAENLVPFSAPLNSPEVHEDRRATFRLKAPLAKEVGGRHTMFVGFNALDLFASFGVLSAGDVDAEKSLAAFLNTPDLGRKIEYLFVGQGTVEAEGTAAGTSARPVSAATRTRG